MVTVGRRAYDLMYRFGAPWEGADRVELRALVARRAVRARDAPAPGHAAARAIDLGCGAGGVSIELAEAGFAVTGVDFSPVALREGAGRRAPARARPGPAVRFVAGDLTAGRVRGVEGPFDLLVDYGTLDDLPRARAARDGRVRHAAGAAGLAVLPVRLLRATPRTCRG